MISRDAGHARGNGRHQQRRRQRIAAAGNVAAHAVERQHALLDPRRPQPAAPPSPSEPVGRRRGGCDRRRSRWRAAPRPARRARRGASRRAALPSARPGRRTASRKRRAPRRRRAGRRSTIARHPALERRRSAVRPRSSSAATAGAVGRRIDPDDRNPLTSSLHGHITILFNGYSTMPCAPRRLELRDQIADRALLDDRVERHPVRRRSAARSSAAAAPAAARAPRRDRSRLMFSMMPTRPCASMAALQQQGDVLELRPLPRRLERGGVGDQLRVRLERRCR